MEVGDFALEGSGNGRVCSLGWPSTTSWRDLAQKGVALHPGILAPLLAMGTLFDHYFIEAILLPLEDFQGSEHVERKV